MSTKIKNPARGRRVQNQKIKSFNAPIVANFRAKSQAFSTKNDKLTNLIGKLRDKRLTESLELLEQQGFTGDLALFILGEIAACGVCDE